MKNFKGGLLLAIMLLGYAPIAFAQPDFGAILKGTKEDVNYLAEGYLSPFLRATANGVNQGWYNTAKPHKIAGFDLTFSTALVGIPSSDKLFTVDNNQLSQVTLIDANGQAVPDNGSASVPTIFGPGTPSTYKFDVDDSEFEGAPGNGEDFDQFLKSRVPVPILNLGIGLPKGTELKIRYTPEIKLGDQGEFQLIGFGLMHNIKQYIPGIKNLPFDLSGFVGYTKMTLRAELDEPGQTGEFSITGTTIQGIISKKLSILTVYGAAGYNIGKGTIDVKGSFDTDGDGTAANNLENPVALSVSSSGPRVSAGMRLKLLIFTFHADYTLQKYSTLTAGVGLSIR